MNDERQLHHGVDVVSSAS